MLSRQPAHSALAVGELGAAGAGVDRMLVVEDLVVTVADLQWNQVYCVLRTENVFVCCCCVGSDRVAGVREVEALDLYSTYARWREAIAIAMPAVTGGHDMLPPAAVGVVTRP